MCDMMDSIYIGILNEHGKTHGNYRIHSLFNILKSLTNKKTFLDIYKNKLEEILLKLL